MGCLVAIIQDLCAVENVDSLLSRSDIYYIAHVGGVLGSSRRRFSSDIFIISDSHGKKVDKTLTVHVELGKTSLNFWSRS